MNLRLSPEIKYFKFKLTQVLIVGALWVDTYL